MIEPNAFVFPIPAVGAGFPLAKPGLTKREWFAGLAMQGVIMSGEADRRYSTLELAYRSVCIADALLAELAKEPAP